MRFALFAGGGRVVGFRAIELGGGIFVVGVGVGGAPPGEEEDEDEEEVEPGAEGEKDRVEEAGCEEGGVEGGEGALLGIGVSDASWGARGGNGWEDVRNPPVCFCRGPP